MPQVKVVVRFRSANESAAVGVLQSLCILGIFPVTGIIFCLYDLPNGCLRQPVAELKPTTL